MVVMMMMIYQIPVFWNHFLMITVLKFTENVKFMDRKTWGEYVKDDMELFGWSRAWMGTIQGCIKRPGYGINV